MVLDGLGRVILFTETELWEGDFFGGTGARFFLFPRHWLGLVIESFCVLVLLGHPVRVSTCAVEYFALLAYVTLARLV